MTKFRFILVEPEYELNVGMIARLMKNFGQRPLYLVNPKVHFGFTTTMYAKHAVDVLKNANICKNIDEATKGCSLIAGTSGISSRHQNALRHPLSLEQFKNNLPNDKKKEVAILFGREGIGLMENELRKCDVLITIPTSKRYPVMNLSHSVAIVLYALTATTRKANKKGKLADPKEVKYLKLTIDKLVSRYERKLKNPEKVNTAFRKVIGRAMCDDVEVRALLSILKLIEKELKNK